MRVTVTVSASDLLALKRTATPPSTDGRLQYENGAIGELYLYATADELDEIADHFAILAYRARKEPR